MKNLIILFFILSNIVFAQTKHIDSLIAQSKYYDVINELTPINNDLHDTEKVKVYSNLIIAYFYIMNLNKAEYYTLLNYNLLKKLNKLEEANKTIMLLGIIYLSNSKFSESKYYLDKALKTTKNKDYINCIYSAYINYYLYTNKYDSCMYYINYELNEKYNLEYINLALANLYNKQNNSKMAINTYNKTLRLTKDINIINQCYYNIAVLTKSNTKIAHTYLDSMSINLIDFKISKFEVLLELFKKDNKIDSLYFYTNQLIKLKDSTSKMNVNEKTQQLSAEFNSKYHVQEAENEIIIKQKQEHFLNAVIIVCLFIILFVIICFVWIKKQKEQKELLANVLEEKNKEITDSINYAKGIQQSILPIALNNAFVYFKPKDIVSGDFYWVVNKNDIRYYAVADCTGHGVPGALLSMMCSQLLDQAIEIYTQPEEIIKWVNNELEIRMSKLGRNDSMEIGLVSITEDNVINYYGIKRPLYIVTKDSLTIHKPKDISLSMQLTKDDMLYITSDGYIDQFGTNGKKFGSARLKDFIPQLNGTNEEQKTIIENNMQNWKGSEEQTDDILIMGIRI